MKARIIQTAFHSDEKMENLSKDAKWLFMYLLTSPYIGLTGAFQVSDKRIQYETGLTSKDLVEAKKELREIVYFSKGWVVVLHAEKHNGFSKSIKTKVAYEKEFHSLPEEIRDVLGDTDTVSKKEDTVSEKSDTPSGILDTPSNPYTVNSNMDESPRETKPAPQKLQKEQRKLQANEVIIKFNFCFGTHYILTGKREKLIFDRLLTFTFEQLCQCCENASRDAFYSGKNDRGWKADPDYLFRSDEIVDKILNLSSANVTQLKTHLTLSERILQEKGIQDANAF